MDEKMKEAYILIVDDNTRNLQVLGKILSDKGFKTGFAQSGDQAFDAIEAKLPDLILLDVMMPQMDGFEVCRRLKETPVTKKIPVIFLTARMEKEDIVRGFKMGAADYVTKPFDPHELIARVETHLQLKFSSETILDQRNEINHILHILSHDISNQLQGMSFRLEVSKIKMDFEESYGSIKSFLNRSIDLVGMVSSLRAMAEKKIELPLVPVNLKSAMDASLETLAYQFEQKNVKPILEIQDDITILAEKTSFVNSVLNNLLTNAVKFSYPGSKIFINARADDSIAEIIIKDSGIGISGESLEKIFEVNKNITRPGTNGEKGTGFGMSLIKHFVNAYGGKIEIASKAESEFFEVHGTEVKLILKLS